MSTINITWCGLDLTVHGEYEPADEEVGIMSDGYIVEEIYCDGARQWCFELCDEHMSDIQSLCTMAVREEAEYARCMRRASALDIDL